MPRSVAPEIDTTHNGECVPASRASREKPTLPSRARRSPSTPTRLATDCPDGRVAHSAHLRKLHSTSCHLRLDGRDLTECIMKWLSLRPRGRLLWTSQRNSASWPTAVTDKEKTNELIDNIFTVWRQTPPSWPLPAFLLRHIWLCQPDSGLYAVAVWSFVFHGLWLEARAVVSSILEPRSTNTRLGEADERRCHELISVPCIAPTSWLW